MQRTGLRLLIFRIGQRAGVPDAGVHRFRHTFAINFLRNGGNLLALQDLLGHERMDNGAQLRQAGRGGPGTTAERRVGGGSVEVVGRPHSQSQR